ncbi:MAG: hypothetical protein HQ517_04915 [SAR324 cluster bacterium]|nr:hypothetical protein [SAR324 cluster bacterium]
MFKEVLFRHEEGGFHFEISGYATFCERAGKQELQFEGHANLKIIESALPDGMVYKGNSELVIEIARDSPFYREIIIPEIWSRYFHLPGFTDIGRTKYLGQIPMLEDGQEVALPS